ncbi:MAG: DUF1549 domain-containing protein [Verrucomicrobiota bacterium]
MKIDSRSSALRALLLLTVALLVTLSASARTWTSTDGRPLKAIFLGIEEGGYRMKLQNGQEMVIPADRFIKADQEAAERLNRIGDDSYTKASAARIDLLLATQLKKEGYSSFNDPLPDDLFVRRVYLDIIGRIPTRAEFLEFAESARPDKREALIDELLLHPGFSSNLFNYFADMYRLNAAEDFVNGMRMDPYHEWWRDQLKSNRPYDEIVREMITAKGNIGQNPASGFLLRDAGMEFDAFANFGMTMLGVDLSCAQCHDDPFNEELSQGDFYEMAAFFGNTQRTLSYSGAGAMMMNGPEATPMPEAPEFWRPSFLQWATENKGINLQDQNSNRFKFFVNALGWNIADNENLETTLPHDFIGSGGKPGDTVSPRTILGPAAKIGGKTRREALADWLIAPDNPRFALVIANRMWDRAFGRAPVEPIDYFVDDDITRNPHRELLKFITTEMQRIDYDLREYMRILYNTRAYQSISTAEEPDLVDYYYFQGPVLRRMRAEQAWDSLMLLSEGPEIDTKEGVDGSYYKAVLDIDFHNASFEDVWTHFEAWQNVYGRRAATARVSEPGSLSNPVFVNDPNIRASEMVQPAPAASMLDTFGQSDRIVTDEHNYDGSVPQVLALMNGPVTDRMTGLSSKIVDDLEEYDGPDDKVRGTFFTLLNRFPTQDELEVGMSMIEDFGDEGISDLAWALMNSPEFLFIQ